MSMKWKNWILPLCLMIAVSGLAEEKIVIDIKVPLTETAALAPAQAGATLFLMRSEWATVSEIGEDMSVWFTGYDRKKNFLGQQVIKLTVEVRDPSTLRIGNLLKKERLTVRYWPTDPDEEKYDQQVLNDLNELSHDLQLEAYHLGAKLEATLKDLLK